MSTLNKRIDEALNNFGKAYYELKSIIDKCPELFPSSVVSCGTIAEFYSILYLQHTFPAAQVTFGNGSQKGWDIRVALPNGVSQLYQVKSTSAFSKTRTISKPTRGFDVLVVTELDADFNPAAIYKFEGKSVISQLLGSGKLIVPDRNIASRRGSRVFQFATDISLDFFGVLSECL